MRRAKMGWRVRIAVLAASSAATLLALEAALRLSGTHPCRPSEDESLFEYHGVYGWQFIPGKRARVVSPGEFEGTVRINSSGMRGGECAEEKPPGGRRIAVLGDSFVANLDVDEKDVFTEVMKGLLPPSWEVLNFGVNGYGPVQECLLLESRVVRHRPDIALLVVYPRNDFDDNHGGMDWIKGYARPKARRADGGGVVIERAPSPPAPRPPGAGDWGDDGDGAWSVGDLYRRFHLYHFVRDRLFYTFNVFMMPEIRLCRRSPSAETEESYALMEGVLGEFGEVCRRHRIEPVVAIAPTIVQVYDGAYWTRMKRKYRLSDGEYDILKPNRFVAEACRRRGIRCVDLAPALRSRARAGARLYYRRNQHWNREGNRLVAEVLCAYLRESGLVGGLTARQR